MKKIIIILALITPFFAQAAHNRCGIGSLIWGKSKSTISQVSEMITNDGIIIPTGVMSIASGTSGCKHNGKFVINAQEGLFIAANMEEMINEIANGSGEVMETYAELIGCSSEHKSVLQKSLKNSIKYIVPNKNIDMDEFLFNLRNEIQLDPKVKTCHAVRVS